MVRAGAGGRQGARFEQALHARELDLKNTEPQIAAMPVIDTLDSAIDLSHFVHPRRSTHVAIQVADAPAFARACFCCNESVATMNVWRRLRNSKEDEVRGVCRLA